MPPARGLPTPRAAVRTVALAVVVAGSAALLGGCAGAGVPKSAGHVAPITGPTALWPGSKPAPEASPATGGDEKPQPLTALPRVPSGDLRKVSAGSVLLAQIDWDKRHDQSAFDKDEERKIRSCADKPGSASCPVRAPEYHDLTGDGKDELILGVQSGSNLLIIYAYTVKDGVVTSILGSTSSPQSVEVADRKLVIHEPGDAPGYESRTVYAWDPRHQVMTIQDVGYGRRAPASATPSGR
ncbi:hypothetical protein MOV08_01075 [Streptomyces yunnanensis]|uniref:Lipoprotein n=1 Tax=Streptomyces yunnanensis TaxID=156453 RepID=A0ABY8A2C0_9ACTN|nr:hypothetical protein [Streptomyces yunnanensis]WEB38040.1 hypothetical protein MOV08_01075 [Streptomyces yunnanensis]